jgi:hypothetical protein
MRWVFECRHLCRLERTVLLQEPELRAVLIGSTPIRNYQVSCNWEEKWERNFADEVRSGAGSGASGGATETAASLTSAIVSLCVNLGRVNK